MMVAVSIIMAAIMGGLTVLAVSDGNPVAAAAGGFGLGVWLATATAAWCAR
jgi:hypothetical protein